MSKKRNDSVNPVPERLRQAIRNGMVFHAYLFEGEHDRTEAMALDFAASLLCSGQDGNACGTCVSCRQIRDGISPHLFRVTTPDNEDPEPGEEKRKGKKKESKDSLKISTKQIEDLIARSRWASISGNQAVIIIDRADTITTNGQNRLLKVLEEPPEGMVFILLTEQAEGLLETIRSRCQIAHPVTEGGDALNAGDAFTKRAIAAAAGILSGKPAVDLWKEIDYFADSREKALRFAETAMLFYRDTAVYGLEGCRDLIVLDNYEDEIRQAAAGRGREKAAAAAASCDRAIRDLKALVSMKHALRYMMFDIQLMQGVKDK